MILLWTEVQLRQRFSHITDNKILLSADGTRDLSDYHYMDFKCTAGILSFPVGLASLAVVWVRVYVCVCMFGRMCGCVWMLLEICKHFMAILNNYCLLLLGATSFEWKAKSQLWKTYFLSDRAVQMFPKSGIRKCLTCKHIFFLCHWVLAKKSYFLIKLIGFLCFLSSFKVEWLSYTVSQNWCPEHRIMETIQNKKHLDKVNKLALINVGSF